MLFCILFAVNTGVVAAQNDEQYFPETDHFVRGAFLTLYHSTEDPLLLFGYPISDELTGADGQTVQYFQRALFERDTAGQVRLAPLGMMQYGAEAPVAALNTNSPACRRFSATGYSVCYSFLRFYDAYDGAKFFGSPISEVEQRDGRYVQYFENARFEWRPESKDGEVVGLTHLGSIEYDRRGNVDRPSQRGGREVPAASFQLQANAFVSQALLSNGSTQNLYVIVQDQTFKPVEDAMVSVSVYFPDGSQYDVRAPVTNANGVSVLSFQVSGMPIKEVVRAEARIDYGSSSVLTRTWFRIWW